MVISKEAVDNICLILELTSTMDLDEILILSNSVIEQTQQKSNLKGPREMIFITLGNRFKKRISEGYVPETAKERIGALILGK